MGELLALLLAGIVVVEAARALAVARRSSRLNRGLHELRRPLQSLALVLGRAAPDLACARACLEQARGGLEELDAAINGRRKGRVLTTTALAEIVGALERRWRWADVQVEAPDPDVMLAADPIGLGAALDNLVANALRHGDGPVQVRALSAAGAARFEVRDRGSREPVARAAPDPRHGHGLPVVAELAARHHGTLIPPRRSAGGATMAAISLPALGPERRP